MVPLFGSYSRLCPGRWCWSGGVPPGGTRLGPCWGGWGAVASGPPSSSYRDAGPVRSGPPLTATVKTRPPETGIRGNALPSLINLKAAAGGAAGVTCRAKELKLLRWGQHPKSALSQRRPPPASHSRPVLSASATGTPGTRPRPARPRAVPVALRRRGQGVSPCGGARPARAATGLSGLLFARRSDKRWVRNE